MLGIVGIECDHTTVIRADRNRVHGNLFERSDNLIAVFNLCTCVLN